MVPFWNLGCAFGELVRLHDGEFVAGRVREVEAAAAGVGEDGGSDGGATGDHALGHAFDVVRVDDNQRSFGATLFGAVEAAFDAGVVDSGVVGTEVLEAPAKQ